MIGTSTTRKPACDGAVGRLDLERVAVRGDRVEVDRLEHLAAEDLEAAGQVADADAEHGPRVGAAAAADQRAAAGPSRSRRRRRRSASRAPDRRRSAAAAAAAGRRGRGRSRRPSARSARRRRRAPGESPRHRPGPRPSLRGPVQDLDVVVRRRQPVGDLAGAVGRRVVDDEDAPRSRQVLAHRADDRLQVVGLVVGRQDQPDGPSRRSPAQSRRGTKVSAIVAHAKRRDRRRADRARGPSTSSTAPNRYRVIAYREAARVIRESPVSVDRARAGRAGRPSCRGSARRSQGRSSTLVETGEIPAADEAEGEVPRVAGRGDPGPRASGRRRPAGSTTSSASPRSRSCARPPRREDPRAEGPRAEGRGERARGARAARRGGAPAERCCSRKVLPLAEQLAADAARAPGVRTGRGRRLGAALDRDLQGHRPDRDGDRPGGAGEGARRAPARGAGGLRRRRRGPGS